MKEFVILQSPHAVDPLKCLTEEEKEERYRTRLDESYRPYTVIDVLTSVYHRCFEDDLCNYAGEHPEEVIAPESGWGVSRVWVNECRICRVETLFFQPLSDFAVELLVPAISIEGFEEATDYRRGQGTYQKVIEAMERLKARKLLFGISCCYTSKNVEVIGSEEYFDSMIDMGAKFAWLFTYMPIGAAAVPELIATAEQRKFMYEQIHKFRETKPIFTMDFWNDGDAVGGCIAGGRGYCHINANGDVEPCAFIHYSDSNIREKTLLEAYQSPLFMAYRKAQPFNENMLRPCPVLDNPGALTKIVDESGAHSTDLESPERACDYCGKCEKAAAAWAPVADEIWENLPTKNGVHTSGKMAKKS